MKPRAPLCYLFVAALAPMSLHSRAETPFVICRGMCDASAVVTLGTGHFAVADDEDNILRVYSRTQGGAALHTMDLSRFLRVERGSPEVDLEAAAPLGDRVYWISSHAVNKNGRSRPSRRRFFATRFNLSNNVVAIEPLGRPYANLLLDLADDPRLKRFGLTAAARRPPREIGALNIEGLCATPEGGLLIGFRNPLPGGKALIVPLLNPEDLLANRRARFGDPMLVDLDGLGVRSLARGGKGYWILAGSYDGEGQSFLYEWSGATGTPRRLNHPELAGLNPESIEGLKENGVERLLVVSDDGTRQMDGCNCKDLKDPNLKCFRAITIEP